MIIYNTTSRDVQTYSSLTPRLQDLHMGVAFMPSSRNEPADVM